MINRMDQVAKGVNRLNLAFAHEPMFVLAAKPWRAKRFDVSFALGAGRWVLSP